MGIFHFKEKQLNKSKSTFVPVGLKIRAREVRCIDQDNQNLGVIDIKQALEIARTAGLDLVQISPIKRDDTPICKVLDYGKYKYELSKQNKEVAKKRRENSVKTKEIKFRPNTGLNDLQVKAQRTARFLEEGNRVKITIVFKEREMAHRDVAYNTLNQFVELVPCMELISTPAMQGRMLFVIGVHKHNVESKAS